MIERIVGTTVLQLPFAPTLEWRRAYCGSPPGSIRSSGEEHIYG